MHKGMWMCVARHIGIDPLTMTTPIYVLLQPVDLHAECTLHCYLSTGKSCKDLTCKDSNDVRCSASFVVEQPPC